MTFSEGHNGRLPLRYRLDFICDRRRLAMDGGRLERPSAFAVRARLTICSVRSGAPQQLRPGRPLRRMLDRDGATGPRWPDHPGYEGQYTSRSAVNRAPVENDALAIAQASWAHAQHAWIAQVGDGPRNRAKLLAGDDTWRSLAHLCRWVCSAALFFFFDFIDTLLVVCARHSHSIVPGGLLVTSYTTRFTPRTSLMMRVAARPRKSIGNGKKSAVIPSVEVTARSAQTYS